ncbi:MAG: hypothetical protein O6826_11445 [Acidobacteria bacterium]|nr:hypothetical protein [Acidobacteriota bacterium]
MRANDRLTEVRANFQPLAGTFVEEKLEEALGEEMVSPDDSRLTIGGVEE